MFTWLEAHPVFYTMFFLPLALAIGGGIFNAFARKRTPEEYAAMPQRVAGFLRLMSAIFPDPDKTRDAAKQMMTNAPPSNPTRSLQAGESVPPPIPKPDTTAPLVLLLVAIGSVLSLTPYALCSCGPNQPALIPPNPDGANCNAKKTKRELDCVETHTTRAEIDACRADVKRSIDCATDAGVAAFVASKEGGT